MFEVIVQASPQDTQSLEILKDAYTRLGRHAGGAHGRAPAGRYLPRAGPVFAGAAGVREPSSSATPNNMEVMGAIGEVEELLQKSGQAKGGQPRRAQNIRRRHQARLRRHGPIRSGDASTLITTNQTLRSGERPRCARRMMATRRSRNSWCSIGWSRRKSSPRRSSA